MRNGLKLIGLAALAAASMTALAQQDSITLKRVAKVGEITKYRLSADSDYQGTAVNFTGLITEKVTKVSDNGDYTVESKTSEGKVSFGGNEMDAGDQSQGATITTSDASGAVLSIVSDMADPNIYRMANLQAIRLPKDAVTVGSTWTISYQKNDKGAVDAKGEFKVEAREKIGTHDTLRIHGTIKEDIKDQPASVDATYWIDVKDGSLVKLTGTWTNAPFPQVGPMTAKVVMTRVD